jgi:hypothetical protein
MALAGFLQDNRNEYGVSIGTMSPQIWKTAELKTRKTDVSELCPPSICLKANYLFIKIKDVLTPSPKESKGSPLKLPLWPRDGARRIYINRVTNWPSSSLYFLSSLLPSLRLKDLSFVWSLLNQFTVFSWRCYWAGIHSSSLNHSFPGCLPSTCEIYTLRNICIFFSCLSGFWTISLQDAMQGISCSQNPWNT